MILPDKFKSNGNAHHYQFYANKMHIKNAKWQGR